MSLLRELRDKINAVADSYDSPRYEGKYENVVSDAGIDLDDFVMLHGHRLVVELDKLLPSPVPFYCRMDAAGSLQECFSQCVECAKPVMTGAPCSGCYTAPKCAAESLCAFKQR